MLTLESVYKETTVFTDRPERDAFPVHTMSTITVMFAAVSAGDLEDDDSFVVDPPNAAFSCALSSGEVVRSVFVLRTPSQSDSVVVFDAELLYSSVSGPIACDGPAVRCFLRSVIDDGVIMSVGHCTRCCRETGTDMPFRLHLLSLCIHTLIMNAIGETEKRMQSLFIDSSGLGLGCDARC